MKLEVLEKDKVYHIYNRGINSEVIPVVHLDKRIKKDCSCDKLTVYLIDYQTLKYHEQSYPKL